ncbi:MAG TPA: 16S rRNA (guanine(527)-N(7))-methyltransferase RsmG [Rhodopila sp.]|uniref:16S rRNA (guanine(527)-N(7))-methyltransferase RsmG n=1 Tax=Rhodopila sp. TaxID=2480087 RepID=UPI002BA3F7F5|nr:16S rRNA (guanine(527)-N(7))-methyltransferase RsmG [Rhodopila sp.]HVY14408.1 16S rRNA (guanine(527)-N(7))-methyltransferase RsmG [Rhodopila sp.]
MQAQHQDRLRRFTALLLRWNATLNLIAPRDAPAVWERHVEDSLQLAPLIPEGTDRAVDLGSGGGFPGLVLAIATGIRFDLIESDRRKAAFLRSAILETGAPAEVHACRIEDAAVPPAPLVTARALAPLPRLLPLVARLLAPEGTCLLLKGARVQEELAAASAGWRMEVSTTPSRTGPDGTILQITGLQAAT